MSLLKPEEKEGLVEAIAKGLKMPKGVDVEKLTYDIWEMIVKLPYPMDTKFNIIGNSSVVDVINENSDSIMRVRINHKKIDFDVLIPMDKVSREDSAVSAFAVMAVVNALNGVQVISD